MTELSLLGKFVKCLNNKIKIQRRTFTRNTEIE